MPFSKQLTVLIALLLIMVTSFSLQAEPLTPYKFKRYSVEDGLSQGTILSMYQDSTGYLWLGTENGLNRFDGYEFLSINNIIGHDVRAITGDLAGNLWVGTTDALNLRKKGSDEFLSYNASNQPLFLTHNVQSLHVARNNTLWIGTSKGLYKKDHNKDIVPVHFGDHSNSFIVAIAEVKKGIIWLGTNHGVFEINTNTNTQKKIILDKKINVQHIRAVFLNSKNEIWVATFGDGLFRMRDNGKKIHHYKAPELVEDRIYAIAEDSLGRMWFGMDTQGIQIFDDSEGFHLLTHEISDAQSLSGNAIEKILLGNNGDVWVGTTRAGLNQHRVISQQFTHLKHRQNSPVNLLSNDVISFAEDKNNNLWLGTFGAGWSVVNIAEKTITYITKKSGLNGNHPIAAVIGKEGVNWLFTETAITKVDAITFEIIKDFNVNNGTLPAGQPSKPVLDNNGNIWYTHLSRGLTKFDTKQEKFTHYNTENSDLPSNIIDSLLAMANGDIWLAHRRGITLFSATNNRFETYSIHGKNDNYYVNDLLLDNKNILWIATPKGLQQFDTINKKFMPYQAPLGMQNIAVSALLVDVNNDVWLSTNKGIYHLPYNGSAWLHFTQEDGLQAGEFNTGVGGVLSNGALAFGGVEGVSLFKPQELKSYNSNIYYSSIIKQTPMGNELIFSDKDLKTLTLDNNSFNLIISLTTLGYNAENKIKYRYREPNSAWIYLPDNKLNIATTTSGEFTYEIATTDSLGHWQAGQHRALKLVIPTPWYKTPIMLLAYLCFAIISLVLLFNFRERKLKLAAENLERQVQERTLDLAQSNNEILRQSEALKLAVRQKKQLYETISHELRTPITLILGPIQQLRKANLDNNVDSTAKLIERNATRLNRLVNQLFDLSVTESVDEAAVGTTNLSTLAKSLEASFKPYASDAKIKLTISSADNIYIDVSLDNAEKLLSNLLSNAIKYSRADDSVSLEIANDSQFATIIVKDTGIGIKPTHIEHIFTRFYRVNTEQTQTIEGSGIGLSIVKNIVTNAHGSIAVASELGRGTTFTVKLPSSSESPLNKATATTNTKQRVDVQLTSDLPHLLLIDDNEDILTYVSSVLVNDYYITTASDGKSGITSARNLIPDIIVSDVMMPGIDGLALLETLKNDELTNHIPIILLTAKGSNESKIKGLKLRADDYMSKPFNEDELLLRLRNILSAKDILKKKFAAKIMNKAKIVVDKDKGKDKPAFILKLDSIIEQHYQNSSFSVADLAKEAAVGERQLLRKLKAMTDVGVKEYIRAYRLNKATELLKQGNTATQVAFEVGFSSTAYFSNCFKTCYGITPSQYITAAVELI